MMLESAETLERHLDETVRTWLGLPADANTQVPRLPDSLARLFLRTEEREYSHRDQWACWEFPFSDNFRRGRLWVPEVDEWVAERRRQLERRVALEPLWPDARPFAMCLTHDVDMVSRQVSPRQAIRALAAAAPKVPSESNTLPERALRAARALGRAAYFGVSRTPSTAETLELCINIENDFGAKGSYFFTVHSPQVTHYDCVYRMDDHCEYRGKRREIRAVARELSDEGFDVGLHGSYLSAFDGRLLGAEKTILEEAIGQPVATIRQHYLRYDVRATPLIQERAGFRADTTLGFNRNVGFRAGTSMPFRPYDFNHDSPLDILEIPLIVMEFSLLRPNSLELDEELAQRVVRHLVDAVAGVGGVATILVHPHSLLDEKVVRLYRSVIEYGAERGAWIATVASIDRWWRDRERRLMPQTSATDHPAPPASV
jgi:peptidoglycan/xylan/chitin deacetylase (PgdA/CDA1 family)